MFWHVISFFGKIYLCGHEYILETLENLEINAIISPGSNPPHKDLQSKKNGGLFEL